MIRSDTSYQHHTQDRHPPPQTTHAQYYEPEPDYETVVEANARAVDRNTVAMAAAAVAVSRQSPVHVVTNRQSPSPAASRQSSSPAVSNRQSPAPEVHRHSPVASVSRASPAPPARSEVVTMQRSETTEVTTTVQTEVPSIRSIRESWQTKQGTKTVDETDRSVIKPQTPTSPVQEENSMSAFGNAIKMAAIAREKRQEEDKQKEEEKKKEKAVKKSTPPPPAPLKKPAAPPPPPPPGPPPAPPPPTSTPPSSQPPTVRKTQMPPHIQKSLEESRQREDANAAIFAAVARRRNIVENANMKDVADTIESKVQKSKKIQSTVYKSAGGKEVVSPNVKKPPTPPPKAGVVESSVSTTQVVKVEALKMEEKREEVQRPPEEIKSPSASTEPTNFTAMAERARLEYLQKKTGATLERKKKNDDTDEKTEDKDNANSTNKACAPSPMRQEQTRNGGSNGSPRGTSPGVQSPAVGDLATIIAQKAAARQKSYENNGNSNGSVGNGYQNSAALGVNTNSNNKNIVHTSLDSRHSVEIKGATIDSSNTEGSRGGTPTHTTPVSVSKRTQIFESQKVLLKKAPTNTGSKTVYRAEGSRSSESPTILPPPAFGDDSPPPMVPPPPVVSSGLDIIPNGHSRHGQETVGWVINSGRPSDSPSGLQAKLAQRNGSGGGGGAVAVGGQGNVSTMRLLSHEEMEVAPTVADVVEVDFIPPPPLFDSPEMNAIVNTPSQPHQHQQHEDAVSMVSSLSTLSTLSSNEQDGPGAASPHVHHRSSSYTINPEPELDAGAPPPPPGFDDILSPPTDIGGEGADFIPPPMGFDVAPPQDLPPATSLRQAIRRKAYQEKAIEAWTSADVCEWLESLQLGQLSGHFSKRAITGQQLMNMGRNELIAIGVTEVSDRMNIERAIKRAIMRR